MPNALIIVDLQNDFISGSLAVAGGEDVAHQIAAYYAFNTDRYDYIVTTQDWHIDPGDHFSDTPDYVDTWPPHCVAGTQGADLHPAVHELFGARDTRTCFTKGAYSAAYSGFEGNGPYGTTLRQWLGIKEIFDVDICGIATDYCVKATALDAAKFGFNTTVLLGLTRAVSPEGREAAITEMSAAGIYIVEEHL